MNKVLGLLLAVVVIVGGGGYLLSTKANAATPVDPLFQVDLFFEDVQRALTLDEVKSVEVEQAILEEREAEYEAILGAEDSSEEEVEDAMQYMNQQRLRTYERLGEIQEKMEQKGNTQAAESLNKVQNKYLEHIERQIAKTSEAQKKFEGVGEEMKQEMEEEKNTLQNKGTDTQNQQQNQEQNTDNGNGGASNSSGKGNN